MRRLAVLLCLCPPFYLPAQDPQNFAQSAVSMVLSQYTMNPLALTAETHQPLPTNGKWSVHTTRPETCPHDDTPCVGVIYKVPQTAIACEWTVVPPQGLKLGAILDQNEDASRYLLRKLSPADIGPLVVTSPQPTYPPISRAAHVTGSVLIRLIVGVDGKITSSYVLKGPEMLRSSTLEAAQHWTFRTLQVGTQAAPFTFDLTGDFSLDPKKTEGPFPKGMTNLHP